MTTWAEVDLSAIRSNAQAIKAYTEGKSLIAVIKADAYGHGAIPIAEALSEDASMYAVATVEEAVELRTAGVRKPILVLFNALPVQAETIVCSQLTQSVCEPALCQALSRIAGAMSTRVNVHLDVDTGMNRGGVWHTEAVGFLKWLTSLEGVEIEGIFTHFATADEAEKSHVHLQLKRFKSVLHDLSKLNLRPPIAHAANTAAALTVSGSYFDAVRVGLGLYGVYPSPQIDGQDVVPLQPALSWKARIIWLREAAAGEGVSYGGTYKIDQPTWLATLPVGYADGYPRALSNLGEALIGGTRRQLVGRVCMDGTVFRIEPPVNFAIGDEAVLIGTQKDHEITVNQVAEKAGTISYEILTGIGRRVHRVYINLTKARKRI